MSAVNGLLAMTEVGFLNRFFAALRMTNLD